MRDVREDTRSSRESGRRGGGLLWLLLAIGVLAAVLLASGVVKLEPRRGEAEVRSSQGREADPEEAEAPPPGAGENGPESADPNRPGLCEFNGAVELRSRLDCLSRGGVFKASDGDTSGSFVTLGDTSWEEELLRRKREAEEEAARLDRYRADEVADEMEPRRLRDPRRPSDWIVCYDRGSSSARGSLPSYRRANRRLRCVGPLPKRAGKSGSAACRARGFSGRRLFKHESSARRWEDENCR